MISYGIQFWRTVAAVITALDSGDATKEIHDVRTTIEVVNGKIACGEGRDFSVEFRTLIDEVNALIDGCPYFDVKILASKFVNAYPWFDDMIPEKYR